MRQGSSREKERMKVLVTGGAGYIGSHVVKMLVERGHDVVAYDNLSNGHRDAVLGGRLVEGDLADTRLLHEVLGGWNPDAVMHFAAYIEVGESVRDPLKYYVNNVTNTLGLLAALSAHKVVRFIFSSTAAVYGNPGASPIPETEDIRPINPYGHGKACVEQALKDTAAASGFRYVSLRYFNAAGADPGRKIGERHNPESHLIPLMLKAAKGERKSISIFGTDYPTPDGTCVRDYIHVNDLADAHLRALEHLSSGGGSKVFNCGYGHGYSVREVLNAARSATGVDIPAAEAERRPGDPPMLVASNDAIRRELGWSPRYDDLDFIIKTAWEWERGR
jgi:UDP-glucose 4-epimerase